MEHTVTSSFNKCCTHFKNSFFRNWRLEDGKVVWHKGSIWPLRNY